MAIGVICKLTCESKYLANAIKDANDEISVYGAEISVLKEFPSEHQPNVPIQFVCCGDSVCRVDDVNVDSLLKEGCTVEQIGAVLYVRGE
ncbi:MAG: hypothetical protein Unbinned4466contig1000_21 [Prokaryotic dsDNA virus sp.]|nr:MAG: hypothetical protein Unbinned4466contig1000_21 [Prokaryotic dsDNA virus sp.]